MNESERQAAEDVKAWDQMMSRFTEDERSVLEQGNRFKEIATLAGLDRFPRFPRVFTEESLAPIYAVFRKALDGGLQPLKTPEPMTEEKIETIPETFALRKRGRPKGRLNDDTIEILNEIMTFISVGDPTTVRFVLYRLVSTGFLPSTEKKYYLKLVNILKDARKSGVIDDECFVDHKREPVLPLVWMDLNAYKDTMKKWYERDYWADQPSRPIILVEKGTVGDVLRKTCSALQTPLFISAGYYSRPFLCQIADFLKRQGKPCHIGYVGDADPSGIDIERAAQGINGNGNSEGLKDILEKQGANPAYTWTRLAITRDDLKNFDRKQLIDIKQAMETDEGEITKGDPRSPSFEASEWGKATSKTHGEVLCAEVEALEREELVNRVRTFITGHTDQTLWEESKTKEEQDQEQLDQVFN